MTITIELPPTIEELLRAEARSQGKDVETLLRAYVMEHVSPSIQPPVRPEDLDRMLDEIADSLPAGVPVLSDEAISRENIYGREDAW
jgi:hypothetical protein